MNKSQTAEEQQIQPATNDEIRSEKSRNPKEPQDTIRVRIWKALCQAQSKEMSLQQLGAIVGERKIGGVYFPNPPVFLQPGAMLAFGFD